MPVMPLSQRLQRRIQHRRALACAGGQAGKQPLFAPDGGIHLHSQLPLTLAVSLVGEGERPQTLVPLAPVCAFAQGKGRPRFKQAPEGGVQLVSVPAFPHGGRERLSCLVHIAHAQPHPPAGLLRRKHRAVAQRLRPMLRQRLRARPGAQLDLLHIGHVAVLKQVHPPIDGHLRAQAGKGATETLLAFLRLRRTAAPDAPDRRPAAAPHPPPG